MADNLTAELRHYVEAASPIDAILKVAISKVNEPNFAPGLKIIRYDVCIVPRSFFDWLFCGPLLWKVTATFEKQK